MLTRPLLICRVEEGSRGLLKPVGFQTTQLPAEEWKEKAPYPTEPPGRPRPRSPTLEVMGVFPNPLQGPGASLGVGWGWGGGYGKEAHWHLTLGWVWGSILLPPPNTLAPPQTGKRLKCLPNAGRGKPKGMGRSLKSS